MQNLKITNELYLQPTDVLESETPLIKPALKWKLLTFSSFRYKSIRRKLINQPAIEFIVVCCVSKLVQLKNRNCERLQKRVFVGQ